MSENVWLAPIPSAIPAELRALGWVVWRGEQRGGPKPTKVPYCVANPSRKASTIDASTWANFEDAVEAYGAIDVDGIGCVLTLEANISCIDLDGVLDETGHLDPRAQKIVTHCASFTERSPSGRGLHVFMRGRVPHALKGDQIEVYATERYIAVTALRWPSTPDDLRDQQSYLDVLVRLHDEDRPSRRPYTGPMVSPPDDLAGALLAKLGKWGVEIARLKRWSDGFLVELVECPWSNEHTTGSAGAAVMIHASGAMDFVCLHRHCGRRTWRDFRNAMEGSRRC